MDKITKKIFISAIEALRKQAAKDKKNALAMEFMFPGSDVFGYDNDLLEKSVITLLQTHFPKNEDFCEIEHYCYQMNFGKIGEKDLISSEDLWDRLVDMHHQK